MGQDGYVSKKSLSKTSRICGRGGLGRKKNINLFLYFSKIGKVHTGQATLHGSEQMIIYRGNVPVNMCARERYGDISQFSSEISFWSISRHEGVHCQAEGSSNAGFAHISALLSAKLQLIWKATRLQWFAVIVSPGCTLQQLVVK